MNFDYLDFYEEHYYTLTKSIHPEVFLAKLRSDRILSESDQDEICNRFAYKTKIQRAGVFIDRLKTKGEKGFYMFKQLLGWEYPHIFKSVFIGEELPPSPKGYLKQATSRRSCDLHELLQEGFKYDYMKGKYNDVMQQLEDLQELLTFTQHDKKDLEMEIQRLQEFEVLNRQLRENLKESEKDNRQVKEENREFMRKNIQLRDENDHQASKIQELLHKLDMLEKQLDCKLVDLDRLNEWQNELKENFEKERRESQRLHRQCNDLKSARTRPLNIKNVNDGNNETNRQLQTKIEILSSDLEGEREHNQCLFEELETTRQETYQQKDTNNKLMSNIYTLKKEDEKNTQWQKKAEQRNEEYFKTIQQLQQEKRKVEEEKIVSQQMNWELGEQKNKLFQRKHELERQLERFQREYDRLKDDIMTERLDLYRHQQNAIYPSGSSDDVAPVKASTPMKFPTLPADMSGRDIICPGNTGSLPLRNIPGRTNQGVFDSTEVQIGSFNGNALNEEIQGNDSQEEDGIYCRPEYVKGCSLISSESSESGIFQINDILIESSPSRLLYKSVVLLSCTALSSVELIQEQDEIKVNELKVEDANLQIGDVILQIQYQDNGEEMNVPFSGLSLADAYKSIQQCINSKPEIVPIHIKPGDTTKREMFDRGEFYIRSNVTNIEPNICDIKCLSLTEGDVIYVDAKYKNEFWRVHKVDQKTGRKMKEEGLIPNIDEARRLLLSSKSSSSLKSPPASPSTQSNSSRPPPYQWIKRNAVRMKDVKHITPYSVVLPMKAKCLMPVMIQGADAVVRIILDNMKLRNTTWAKVINEKTRWKEMTQENKHVVMPFTLGFYGNDDKTNNFCLIIKIVCKPNKRDCIKKLFGSECASSLDSDGFTDTYSDTSSHLKTLTIDENITDIKCLLDVLHTQITSLQSEVFWFEINS